MINALPTNLVLQNRYQVVRLLGHGGFGAVYLAQDIRLSGRAVAVKENFDASAQAQAQFKIEADVLATLNHLSLPRVTDYFIEPSGRQYLVMDYVEGNDLKTIVAQHGCLSEPQALPWIEQVCDALTYLHTRPRPVIHRDIKPGNIRVRSDGRAMLVDFGIAKLYDATQKTLLGARAVSAGYSPLEQYGQGLTDARSDIYALGATMYFVFTGKRPPDATDLAARLEQLRPPRLINPCLSPGTEQVVLKAMAVSPDARYPTAATMQQALRALMTPVQAPVAHSAASPSQIVCPLCGALNRAAARHCKSCGKPLQKQPASVPPQPAPAIVFFPTTTPSAPIMPASTLVRPAPAPTPAPRPARQPKHPAPSASPTVSFWRFIVTVVVLGVLFAIIIQMTRSMPTTIQVAVMSIAAPLAFLLLKRPGAAFLTFAIQSNLIGYFNAAWIGVGIGLEVVFALGRYQSDEAGTVIAASVLAWIPFMLFVGSFNFAGEILFGGALGGLAAYFIKRIIKR